MIKCKNCGCDCASNYCPDCGQSVTVKRLENKSFFIGLASGISRINRGFLYTAWQLLINPWKVIRDYIQCRRVKYVAPVSMLIVVCFLNAFVAGLMSTDSQSVTSDIDATNIPVTYKILMAVIQFLTNNMLARNLTIYLPAMLSIWIVYRKAGAKRYNLAEYFAAMIYMTSAFLIFGVIISPLSLASESLYTTLEITYTLAICSLSMYHAFPLATPKKRITHILLYLLVSALTYILLLIAVATILAIDFTLHPAQPN